ncbi:TonB-dependent receptor plug domain-containing protein [Thalassotalea sp. PLHSN55]|uniref:TonB-dependent receptor plug domain-containing protein n=1 Tax=Thalassotalea sp. PLHSN55 TaxID=3435888 RepID=UPI003F86791A
MQPRKLNTTLTAIALLISGSVLANDNQSAAIETISVYGQLNPIEKSTLPSTVFILNNEDIARIVGNTALDLLAQVPGINIKKSGNIQDISLRGAESNFVIIQIDGVQVNNPLDERGGSFDLASLSKDLISRVEVIKGTQSAIYGSDALAGVINFITVDKELKGVKTSLGLMADGQKSATVKAGFDSWGLALSGIDTDEQSNGDSQTLAELSLYGDFNFTKTSNTQLNWRFADYKQYAFPDQSGGAEFAQDETKEKNKGQTSSASIRHQISINDAYQTALHLEHYHAQDNLTSPGISPYFMAPPAYTSNDYTLNKFRWLNSLSINNISANAGLDYKHEDGQTSGYLTMFGQDIPTDFELTRKNWAGFIDTRIDLAKASMFLGVRLDKPEDHDNQTTWKFGINYPVSDNIRLFTNAGESFKLPSLYALGNNMIGNAELVAETAKSADIGIEWTTERTNINFSLFDYRYKNLIDFDGELFSLVNRSSVETQGAELVLVNHLTSDSVLQFNVTYADIEAGEGELLTGRPKWQGGANLNWQWTEQLSTYISANYVGESTATSLHTGNFSAELLPSYSKYDVSGRWVANQHLSVDLFLTNALDKQYYYSVGFGGPERGAGIKINWLL